MERTQGSPRQGKEKKTNKKNQGPRKYEKKAVRTRKRSKWTFGRKKWNSAKETCRSGRIQGRATQKKRKCSTPTNFTKKKKKHQNGKNEEEAKEKRRKEEEKSTNVLPPKKDDPRTFSFYCCVGNILQCDTLADLGSCTNILPLSMYKSGRLGELKPANTILRFADSTTKYLERIVENVKVKVGNMTFLAYFMVLDTTEDVTLPVIFGRPFFAITNAIINVAKGEMELSDGHSKKKTFYAAKIIHKALTPLIPDLVLEYVRRNKREYEE